MYHVTVNGNRPDFRIFVDLLYGVDRNVDTDGDSDPVNSRTWSYLYIADRESDDPFVEIGALVEQPKMFSVESKSERLEELTALYLFMCCGAEIADSSTTLSSEQIESLKVRYSVELSRAAVSRWHRSSDEEPYPKSA
ncbi:hypothetical protein BCF11_3403 [Collimonas sp. PA-H2]|uniref:hypothetical protein n=1 Tax=Collimonas sp. PA-H2 TaxID=1881062 RepID=UPI000BF9EF70|nr:hypothetical protein [Collimonas sp. PA-H2]PFH10966.1 hypothetical protein BCF11_3403 [Collimonas sp. PA-H2]